MPSQTQIDINEIKTQLSSIKTELLFHRMIGGAVIGTMGLFLWWFFTTYIPREQQREATVGQLQANLDPLAKLQLQQVQNQIETARSSGVTANKNNLSQLGSTVLSFANSNQPEIKQASWNATNQLLGYFSTITPSAVERLEGHMPVLTGGNIQQSCFANIQSAQGLLVSGFFFVNCTVDLDEFFGLAARGHYIRFENIVFRNARVIYDGAPISVPGNVYFVNCTFELQPSAPSEQIARTFLAENRLPPMRIPR
jgi:hypothetical protein